MHYNTPVLNQSPYIRKSFRIFLVVFLACFYNGYTQEAPLEENNALTKQLWLSFDSTWELKDSTYLKTDVGYRTISTNNWDRYIARGGYEKNVTPFILKHLKRKESYIGGLGLFYFSNKAGHNSLEIRPFQGYRLNFDITKRIQLANYFRLEERFLITAQDNSNHFGLRFRYQIMANIGLQGFLFSDKRGFYFPVGIEFFFNIVELSQFSDVIRITPGAGYQFNPTFKVQGMLAYHYTEQDIGGIYKTNDIIFRLKVIKTF
ncbi:DUF2490 domain-containing protein [Tamlana haliotis]|uniref:DUF2490 domain-containing protein n=1 Tax=Pseudotamlana haliotis TaxID=2614804 RepID=A0A6N6MGL5_9FLAO|nr:DUF2490 domain-containing protein [Tamlana haliotis]KAB1067941.1 DUF2490 domain-containing protein [Tamlana haliotis]